MPLQPVSRRSLTDEVFEQLSADILAGELLPGAPLPSERALAEALGVSRPAVREALQRLSQSGLVDIRQGETTTVRDYRTAAGLELLPRLLLPEGELDLRTARSIVEVRAAVGPHIARLAAARGGPAAADELDEVVVRLRGDTDAVARQRAALDFWDRMVDASDNIAFRLMFNALRAAYEPLLDVLAGVLATEVSDVDGYATVVTAVREGRPAAAAAATVRLLDHGTRAVLDVIEELTERGDR